MQFSGAIPPKIEHPARESLMNIKEKYDLNGRETEAIDSIEYKINIENIIQIIIYTNIIEILICRNIIKIIICRNIIKTI